MASGHIPPNLTISRYISPYHGTAARGPCMEASCFDHAIALVRGTGERPRLQGVRSELGACRPGRGGSRLGAWRLRQRRLDAPEARLPTAPHGGRRPLAVGVEAAMTAPMRRVALWMLGRDAVPTCAGLGWRVDGWDGRE